MEPNCIEIKVDAEEQERLRRIERRRLSNPNFTKYFRHIDSSKPEKGDILAKFGAIAEIVEGQDKDDLINLCLEDDSAKASSNMMRKIFHAAEWDVYGIPRHITEDCLNGMSVEEMKQKIYSYAMELFFYTKPEYMPQRDDPDAKYWSLIQIVNLEDYLKIEVKDQDGNVVERNEIGE